MGAQPKELSVAAVRQTIATSLAAAFGFVIALLWKEVVLGTLSVAGVSLTPGQGVEGLGLFFGTAIGLTVLMVIFIVLISRWGGRQ